MPTDCSDNEEKYFIFDLEKDIEEDDRTCAECKSLKPEDRETVKNIHSISHHQM